MNLLALPVGLVVAVVTRRFWPALIAGLVVYVPATAWIVFGPGSTTAEAEGVGGAVMVALIYGVARLRSKAQT